MARRRNPMAERVPMTSVLPFVAYSTFSRVLIPMDKWEAVYSSLQTLKGHTQEYPGCQSMQVWVRVEDEQVVVHCYTTWDTPSQLEAFLERGYTFERMLAGFGGLDTPQSELMERIF